MSDYLQEFLEQNEIPYSDFVKKVDLDYELGLITALEAIDQIIEYQADK